MVGLNVLLSLCVCVTPLGLAEGVVMQRRRMLRNSHTHSRLGDSAADPCQSGLLHIFRPELHCSQTQIADEPENIIVVTKSTCQQMLDGLRTKTAPYWDLDANRCAAETRVQLLEQCSHRMGLNFSTSIQVRRVLQLLPRLA